MDVEERVRGYACDAVPDCTPEGITAVSRFPSGEQHAVYKVSYAVAERVDALVVRIARSEEARDAHRAEREAIVLRTVQGRAGPLLHDFRRESQWFDAPTTCTQFVAGEQQDPSSASAQDLESLGTVVGWVHGVPLDDLLTWFPETPEPTVYLASRLASIDVRMADFVRDPLPHVLRRRVEDAARLTTAIVPEGASGDAASPVLQHGDIAGGNIVWTPAPVLLDWEYCRLGDPADEIAYLFSQNGLDDGQRRAFWRGYGDGTGKDTDAVAARVEWWEPVTLLGSVLWWIEQWSRRGDAASPQHYLENAVRRLGRLEELTQRQLPG